MVTFGILLSYCIGYIIEGSTYIIFILPIFTSILQASLFKFVYYKDTATFLMIKNRKKEAMILMNELYFGHELEDDSDELLTTSQINEEYHPITYKELFTSDQLSETLKMGCVISILQQFSGINLAIVNSTKILPEKSEDKVFTIIIGLTNCLFGSWSIFLLKTHYKKNLQYGAIGMCVCYLLTILSLFADFSVFQILYFTYILIFVFFFEVSIGPIMWIYCADVLSEKGVAITTATNWLAALAQLGIFSMIDSFCPLDNNNYYNPQFVSMNCFNLFFCIMVKLI
jgi:facilitated trehalose transporter